jgi:putative NIF3 family GTP cyclohydrolase 1 type 2
MINKMGIRQFSVNGSLNYFILPEKTVGSFAGEMKQKFGLEHIRIVGNPEMKFTKLAFMAGAPGGQNHVKMLRKKDVEVVIGGEAPEWETYMYAKDAASLGMNKAVIFLGHIKSEEAGMQYCGEWLKSFIKNVPIHFIPNMDNYKEL